MKKYVVFLSLICTAVAQTGCTSMAASMLVSATLKPGIHWEATPQFEERQPTTNIEVLQTNPSAKYIELGTVAMISGKKQAALDGAIEQCKKVGADALVLTAHQHIDPLNPFTKWIAEGTAIRYAKKK